MTEKKAKTMAGAPDQHAEVTAHASRYYRLLSDISDLLDRARRSAARSVNSILTAAYWETGRRIVEFEQGGKGRAEYGEALLRRLADDLSGRLGRGFSQQGLYKMRGFYLGWQIFPTASGKLEARAILPTASRKSGAGKLQTPSAESDFSIIPDPSSSKQVLRTTYLLTRGEQAIVFPLSWSQYVRLMAVGNHQARAFYESEAIRGGWSVRQLDRQIGTQFYERSLGSKNREEFLARGSRAKPGDRVSLEEEIRDPYLLEFLNLKDEYSETDLEEALIRHLEWFLLELGSGFAFVARQKRIRVGDSWYRIDLLLFHRGLRCLVVIDLKRGPFSHSDAGQMNLYLNYVKEHMMMSGEVDPVGIILCGDKDDAVVKYATGGIRAKVFASKYMTILPDKETLRQEILKTRRLLETRQKEGKSDE